MFDRFVRFDRMSRLSIMKCWNS